MSDLRSRLLAAVTGNSVAQDARNAGTRCDCVTAFNSLENPGVTLSPLVTPELSSKIIAVTPSHADSANQKGQGKNDWTTSAYGRHLAALRERCPELVEEHRWQEAVADAHSFLVQWGERAAALGWTAGDLFCFHSVPDKPAPNYRRLSRYDETGLIWLLRGRPVIALTEGTAAIENPTSAITIYRKTNKPALGPVGDSLDDLDPLGPR